jgi:hypothetical protein
MKRSLPLLTSRPTGLIACTALFLLGTVTGRAGDLPKPTWLLQGSAVETGKFTATIPKGDRGEVTGDVTVENGAIVFSGQPGEITFPFAGEGVFGGPFSVVARIIPEDVNGYGPILSSNPPVGFVLRVHGHKGYSASAGGLWNAAGSTADSFKLGQEQFVALTYDGSVVRIYVDGQDFGEAALDKTPEFKTTLIVGSVGRAKDDGSITDVPHFRLLEVAVYDSTLTKEQISDLAEAKAIPAN